MSYHCYKADTKIYFSVKPNNLNQLSSLHECLAATKEWMSLNFLHINLDKTEIILFGPDEFVTAVDQFIGPLRSNITSTAKNLGIIFDQHMTFDLHVTKLVQSDFLQLHNVAKIKRFLSSSDMEQLIHSLIFSYLDHCKSLYTLQASLNRLQSKMQLPDF